IRHNRQPAEVSAGLHRLLLEEAQADFVWTLRGDQGEWRLLDDIRLPTLDIQTTPESLHKLWEPLCQHAVERNEIQIARIDHAAIETLIAFPQACAGQQTQVLLLGLRSTQTIVPHAVAVVQLVAAYQQLWEQSRFGQDHDWQMHAVAAICEATTRLLRSEDAIVGLTRFANDLQAFLGVERVAFAWGRGVRTQIVAMSGLSQHEANSDLNVRLRQALVETTTHGELIEWDARSSAETRSQLTSLAYHAHQRLGREFHFQHLLSIPLTSQSGEIVGAWLIANPPVAALDRIQQFLRASEPHIGTAIAQAKQRRRPRLSRLIPDTWRKRLLTLCLLSLVAAIVVTPFVVKIPYRVRCPVVAQPVLRRYASAPFNGMIQTSLVEAGDLVRAGDPLAQLDGREVRWKLAGVIADREKALRERNIKLASDAVSESLLASLEQERLFVEQQLLQHQEEHLTIAAPCDGIVLSSAMRRGEGKPVGLGDVLFEIGPLSPMRLELEVPTDEATQLAIGQSVQVWLNGVSGDPLTGIVAHIAPRAEERASGLAVIAEVEIANEKELLRPGMSGTARITTPRQTIAWCLFHKPWEWVRSTIGF
ncbi:MAG: HlyD family efflux transporter periplasmic adaptor subunit, partial [Planctomycetaceae bacterium]|nr:HlyD family efflux transporter periplasmic adaptor subunit [Planctomycetaceae bacterium]